MRLERREMSFLLLAGICLIAITYYLIIISPALSRHKSLTRFIEKKGSDMVQMIARKGEWDKFRKTRDEAKRMLTHRGKMFTLLSFLESVSRKGGIHNNIAYMKPLSYPEESGPLKREGIEIKLDDIDTKQLVKFLHRIEYSEKLLYIERINIKRKAKEKSVSVTLQINTYVNA